MAQHFDWDDGHWEGDSVWTCDECKKQVRFRFRDEDEAKNYSGQKSALSRKRGWIHTKVDGRWKNFCCENCRNAYIRKNTFCI